VWREVFAEFVGWSQREAVRSLRLLAVTNKRSPLYELNTVADEVEQLAQQAHQAEGAERVELLARAANLAIDPLRRIELLMLVADAAGRVAHQTVAPARRGENRAGNLPATYEQIGVAAGLNRDVIYRQYTYGAALSWPAARRGVHNGRTSSCQESAAEGTDKKGEAVT
jgi:hypothetical protein